jgi:hypothetical protein
MERGTRQPFPSHRYRHSVCLGYLLPLKAAVGTTSTTVLLAETVAAAAVVLLAASRSLAARASPSSSSGKGKIMIDYSNFVKVKDGEISREPVPGFLTASQTSIAEIADLTWLGLPDYVGYGWWPIEFHWPALDQYQSYNDDEVLTLDAPRTLVVSTRSKRDWTAEEILDYKRSLMRHITKLAFRNRFTLAEKIAFEMAQVDDPTATHEARLAAAGVRVLEKDLAAGAYVDLNAAAVQAGLAQLEALGVLAAGRAGEITWGDVEPYEVP